VSKKQRDHEQEVARVREKAITEAQAKTVIERNVAERVARCRQKIETACAQENCAITPEMVLRAGQVMSRLVIIPKNEGDKK